MTSDRSLSPSTTVRERGGSPLLRILASFPIACFCCALGTDVMYARSANVMWADFSDWLLAAGILVGVLAALAGLVRLLADRRHGGGRTPWLLVAGSVLALILAFFDNLVHSRDAWTSVVPTGLTLSAATVIVMLATAWVGAPRPARQPITRLSTGVRS